MSVISKYWKQTILGGCAVVNAVAYYVPALLPVAQICAVATPVVAGAPNLKALLQSIVTKLVPVKK